MRPLHHLLSSSKASCSKQIKLLHCNRDCFILGCKTVPLIKKVKIEHSILHRNLFYLSLITHTHTHTHTFIQGFLFLIDKLDIFPRSYVYFTRRLFANCEPTVGLLTGARSQLCLARASGEAAAGAAGVLQGPHRPVPCASLHSFLPPTCSFPIFSFQNGKCAFSLLVLHFLQHVSHTA